MMLTGTLYGDHRLTKKVDISNMTWSNDTKTSSNFTNDTKPAIGSGFVLKEDAFYLLLETGDKIILDQTVTYNNDTKNPSSWSNDAK